MSETAEKRWSSYMELRHCSGAEHRRNVVRHVGYLLRKDECIMAFTDSTGTRDEIKKRWKDIADRELSKRVDARMQSRLVIPLPNDVDLKAFREEFGNYFGKLALRNHTWLVTVHKGESGDVERNLHGHLVYNDRDLVTGKKNRDLMSKEFLQAVKGQYERFLESQGYTIEPRQGKGRERLSRAVYEAKRCETVAEDKAAIEKEHDALESEIQASTPPPVAKPTVRKISPYDNIEHIWELPKAWLEQEERKRQAEVEREAAAREAAINERMEKELRDEEPDESATAPDKPDKKKKPDTGSGTGSGTPPPSGP